MGVSVSVACTAYQGRVIRLTAEQLRYENGQSYVAWRVSSEGGAGSYYGIGPITASIDGTVVYSKGISYYSGSSTASFPVAKGSVSGGVWITHSGSRTITVSLRAYVYMDTGEGPFTGTLTLPVSGSADEGTYAATPISLVTGGDIGSKCTVAFTPDWEGYHYRVSYTLEDRTWAWDFHPASSGVLVEVQIPLVYDLAQGLEEEGSLIIRLGTYRSASMNSAAQVGKNSTWVLKIRVTEDDQTRPRITGASLSPSPDLLEGAYLQNKTGILGAVTAEARYGAEIRRVWFRVEGRDYEAGQVSALLTQYGPLTVLAYAQDSRGFTSLGYPLQAEVLPYSPPRLRPVEGQTRVAAVRCDGEGNPQDNGAFLILKARREYSPLIREGVQRNFCTLRYRYKGDASGTWSAWTELLEGSAQTDSVVSPPLLGSLAPRSSYQVELQAADTLGSTASTVLSLYSDRIYWHRHGALGSLGFGKYAEEADVFDIAAHKTLRVRGGLDLQGDAYGFLLDLCHPVGSVLETTREESPSGYLGGSWELSSQSEAAKKWRRTQ